MSNYILGKDGELFHYGVKGMKWGVRKDENAKIKATSKRTYDESRRIGASKDVSRRLAWDNERDVRSSIIANRAIDSVNQGSNDAKQRAKNYQNALNLTNTLAADQLARYARDRDTVKFLDERIQKLRNKPENVKRRKKIDQLTTDSELLELSILEAEERYTRYKNVANQILDKMKNDNALVYRTRKNTIGGHAGNGTSTYSVFGTDYDVKKKTGSKRERKKFSDSNHKEYAPSILKTTVYYY